MNQTETDYQLNAKERRKLKEFVKELDQYRGRHTELVSVYVPHGYDLNKIIQHLEQEKDTATNIKSASNRKNVQDALEKMIQHLRVIIQRTPAHGLAVFSGNIAERDGQQEFKVWAIEPPAPMNQRFYRCDKEFVLDPLKQMIDDKNEYGLVVLDGRDATIAILRGKTIIPIKTTHSEVPGKMRAGGQCLLKNSLVQIADGEILRVEDCHNPIIVKSRISDNSIKDSPITDKWTAKKSKVYKVITKNPRLEIESSKDHLFFVATSGGIIEKPASELKKGDNLIMPEKINIKGKKIKLNSKKYYNSFIITEQGRDLLKQKRLEKGLLQKQLAKKVSLTQTAISSYEIGKINPNRNSLKAICGSLKINFQDFLKKYTKQYLYKNVKLPNELNEEFAQFLGYYLGDGSVETDRITFFEQNKQVALAYQRKFNKFFGMKSSYRFRQSKNYHQIRFTSRPLVRLVRNEFSEIKKALESEIPNKVLQSNNSIVAAFLKGLFDAEGYIHSKRGIGLGMNNKKLVQQIQLILLRFSILSSLYEYDNRANKYSNNPRFSVDMTEKKSIELFKKLIGFTSSEKNKKLNIMLKSKSNTSYNRQILIPGKKIRAMIEKAGYNLGLFPKVNNFFRNERMMSKQIFKTSILNNVKDKKLYKKLEEIYNYPILPVKINKIEKTNKKVEMIDISVKDQSFIANGIFVHNSAPRFQRLRAGALNDHFKKIADYMKDEFLPRQYLKGIIIGGPGTTVNNFLNKNHITGDVQKKILGVKDLSYTGEFGLHELVEKADDILSKEDIIREKKLMKKFFLLLSTQEGKVAYGKDKVMQLVKEGIVDTVILSEVLDDKVITEFEDEAEKFATKVEVISTETTEGVQLRDMGKVVAILRYDIEK